MPDLTAPCDWHDNDLHLQLPELPGRILVTLPDKRGREVYSARVHEYAPKDENDRLRKLVAYMHRCYVRGHDWGPYGAPEKQWVEEQMHELGIEV